MQAPPKFASFRAKAAPPTPLPEEEAPVKAHQSHRHRQHKHQHVSRHRNATTPEAHPVLSVAVNDVFYIDRQGDVGNQTYGTNSKTAIPAYWSMPPWKTLGGHQYLEGSKRAVRPLSSLTREDRKRLKQEGAYIRSVIEIEDTPALDFVALNPGRKRKRISILGEPAGPLTSILKHPLHEAHSAADATNLRIVSWARSTASPSEESESEGSTASDLDMEDEVDSINELKQENARLSALVKSQPRNIHAWQELVNFQDVWSRQGNREDDSATSADHQSVSEVKLAIYKKALDSVAPAQRGRQLLLVGMMKEAESVLEHVKLASRWHEIADNNRHLQSLWLRYLNFSQATFATFGFDQCRDRYSESLGFAESDRDPVLPIYTFLRATMFVSDAGYHELAVALWQAIFELNCNPALGARTTTSDKLSDTLNRLEGYWDSEQPRIGERSAIGHKTTQSAIFQADDPQVFEAHAVNNVEEPTEEGAVDPVSIWCRRENQMMAQSSMPGRTIDDADDEDPYHIVLFSDVSPLVGGLGGSLPDDHPTLLVNAFLCFCGLPALATNDEPHRPHGFWRDSYLRNDILDDLLDRASSRSTIDSAWCQSFIDRLAGGQPRNTLTTTELLFNTPHAGEKPFLSNKHHYLKRDFVSDLLRSLVERYPTWNDVAEYYLAFEAQTNPMAAKKSAKALLKRSPTNLRLYNAYALIEVCMGDKETASRVFSTAISMSMALDVEDRQAVILLWRSWVWEALRNGETSTALARLLAIRGGKPPQAAHASGLISDEIHYQIQDHLTSKLHTSIASPERHNTVYYMELLALLNYLATPSSPLLPAALTSYDTSFALLSSSDLPSLRRTQDPTLELLHQSLAHLLSYHIRSGLPYRPVDVRDALTRSITLFPSNTAFLELYAENERRFRVDDRVRDITRSILLTSVSMRQPHEYEEYEDVTEQEELISGDESTEHDNVITHAFDINTELRRGIAAGSTKHTVRAAFERAVNGRACRHNAGVWAAYVAYECSLYTKLLPDPDQHHQRDKDKQRADARTEAQKQRVRDIFYRGLRNLPWVKRYAMLAFSLLRPAGLLDHGDCRSVYQVLVEKGIRLHHEME